MFRHGICELAKLIVTEENGARKANSYILSSLKLPAGSIRMRRKPP
jgi:hypothetical protein